MKVVRDILRDSLLSLLVGLGIGIGLLLVFAVVGGIANGLQGALEVSRGVVLVVGGLLMIYSAILMLKGGNLPTDAFTLRPWKQQRAEAFDDVEPLKLFRKLPRQYACLLIALGILTTSVIPESVVLYYL